MMSRVGASRSTEKLTSANRRSYWRGPAVRSAHRQ